MKKLAFPSGIQRVDGMSHSEARWDVKLQLSFREPTAGSCSMYDLLLLIWEKRQLVGAPSAAVFL